MEGGTNMDSFFFKKEVISWFYIYKLFYDVKRVYLAKNKIYTLNNVKQRGT